MSSWSEARNSAAEAALDLYRNGARVTLVHRSAELGKTIKYWVRPDIENRIRARQIRALFETRVTKIEPGGVLVEGKDGSIDDWPPVRSLSLPVITLISPFYVPLASKSILRLASLR